MFTYDAIGTFKEFTLLRPVFVTLLAMMVLVFLTVVVPKFKSMYHNVVPIILMSVVGLLSSFQLFFYSGVLIDELGLSGDFASFFLFISINVLAVLNPSIYLWNKHKEQSININAGTD